MYQQTTRHGIAQMIFLTHIEKHHQRALSGHLRSRGSSINGTTGHAASLCQIVVVVSCVCYTITPTN